jgi:L-methionine (R)-S-oxide reductase
MSNKLQFEFNLDYSATMTYVSQKLDYKNKIEFYKNLNAELLYNLDKHWFTNLSQFSALVFDQLPDVNWVGFYLNVNEELILGPFQGKPACMKIQFGRGVCGTSAQKREPILVMNVDQFPGHIACDSASKSEVVIPLIVEQKVLGVLDVDSPSLNRFSKEDVIGLSTLVETLLKSTVIAI